MVVATQSFATTFYSGCMQIRLTIVDLLALLSFYPLGTVIWCYNRSECYNGFSLYRTHERLHFAEGVRRRESVGYLGQPLSDGGYPPLLFALHCGPSAATAAPNHRTLVLDIFPLLGFGLTSVLTKKKLSHI